MSYSVAQTGREYYQVSKVDKTFPARNTDEVLAGCYDDVVTTGGQGVHGDDGGNRWYLNKFQTTRIRQDGYVTKIKLYVPDSPDWEDLAEYWFCIWRKDGTTYDLVGKEDISSSLTINQINTVTLSTPILAQEGDYTGFGIVSSGASRPSSVAYVLGNKTDGLIYTNQEPDETDYAWDSQNVIQYLCPIQCYMQAPLFVGIGNSIMAGHPDHYSFIEGNAVTDLSNQIMYQLEALNSLIIYQNMGIGSQGSALILARFTEDVINLKPKYCVIMAGVNDIVDVTKSVYITNMTSMLDLCDNNSIIPVVIKVIPWTNGSNAMLQIRDEWMEDLETLVATYDNAIFVDMDPSIGEFRTGGDADNLWDIQSQYDADGVHLNEAGYTKMAQKIYSLL